MMHLKRKNLFSASYSLINIAVLFLAIFLPLPGHTQDSQIPKSSTPIADFFNRIYQNIPEPPAWVGIVGNAAEPGSKGLTDSAALLQKNKGATWLASSSKNVKAYAALGEKISKVGNRTNILIDTVGNVASVTGALFSGDKIGTRQETANAVLSGTCASVGGAAGGKIFFVVGGVLGGPPGAMVGGSLGTAGGALGGSYFYEKVWKPKVTQGANEEFNEALDSIQENNEQDPIQIEARLKALVRNAKALLKDHQLDAASDKAQKVLNHLENTKYILVNAGLSDKVSEFNTESQEIIKSVAKARQAIVKASEALDNAKTLDSAVLIKELFKSVLEENMKGLEVAGRQDLIEALSRQPADSLPPPVPTASALPDIIEVDGRYIAEDHKGWAEDCHVHLTINFVQKTVTGLVSGYISQGPKSHPFAVGGPIKEMAYAGTREKGSFEGKVEVFYHGAKIEGFPPVDGSMIYPISGSLEGNFVKASLSECGTYEMKIP